LNFPGTKIQAKGLVDDFSVPQQVPQLMQEFAWGGQKVDME